MGLMSEQRLGVPARLVAVVALGVVLNPLNSTMIAIALVGLQHEFEVGVATSSWLVSGFYLAASIGQPLMGRFVDLFGARRLFIGGLALQCLVSGLAAFAPGFWWLVALRVLQGIGSSTAFPAALVLIRETARKLSDKPPAGALAALTVSASMTAVLGPALGGLLMTLAGWRAIFLVNLPLTLIGMALALRFLPRDPAPAAESRNSFGQIIRLIDVPGIVLFGGAVATFLVFLLSAARDPRWWLLPLGAVLAIGLVWRELRTATPFLDVRGIAANRALASVLGQQGGVNLVFYCLAFGLPMWLETVRGFDPGAVGLLVLPLTLSGVLVAPLATRLIRRWGSRAVLLLGTAVLLAATFLLQFVGDATPIALVVLIVVVLGFPNGFNNIGLQTALYDASPPDRAGSTGGLFQLFRYLGAIGATTVLALVFETNLSSDGLHDVGVVMIVMAVAMLGLALSVRRIHAGSSDSQQRG
ncbi:MFS transporter [Flindersiella endophytica]